MDLLARFRKPHAATPAHRIPLALPALRKNHTAHVYVIPRVRDEQTGDILTLDRVPARYPRAALTGEPASGTSSALAFLGNGGQVLSLADFHPLAPPQQFENLARILLDDVAASRVHAEYLTRLIAENPNAQVYVAAEDAALLPGELARLTLLPFHERELASAIAAWLPGAAANAFSAVAKGSPLTRRLVYNPLDLFLLLQVYAPDTPLPTRRAELFDAYLTAHLKTESDPELARRALEGIALSTKRGQVAQDEHLARGYGLLRKADGGRITFAHALLHDFLAAAALRRNPDLAPVLERLDDGNWQQVILFYVGLATPEGATAIAEAFAGREQWDRAALALGQAAEIPDALQKRIADKLIPRAWENEDPAALAGLRAMRSGTANEFFAARLKERNPELRARAARILGRLQSDRAIEALLPQLRETNGDARDQVVAALGASKSDRVIEPLLVALRGDNRVGAVDTRLRVAAARALGQTGSERAVPALIVDLQVGEPEVRTAAARALVQIRSDLALKPLQAIALSNAADEVRATAAQVLQAMQEYRSTETNT
ncbi:MAG: HEAT repeat domain-containing protein [Anaerolineae bacterium]